MNCTIFINISEELALLCIHCGQTPETLIKSYFELISPYALDEVRKEMELNEPVAGYCSMNRKAYTAACLATFIFVISFGYNQDISKDGLPPFGDSLE